jgi:DnaK suppressor protein
VKPQPKAAAKAKKPAAKAKPAAKPAAKAAKPAVKAVARKAAAKPPAKAAKPAPKVAAKAAKPAAKAGKPAAKAPAAKKAAGVVAKAVKAVKQLVKAVQPAPKKPAPAKVAPAPAAPAKVSVPPATPAAPVRPAVPVAPARTPAQSARAAAAAAHPANVPPTAVKASYTPMASNSVLNPPPIAAVKKDPKLANNWKTKSAEELSDAEVLAMPDSEYMNDKQMAFFRLKLQQLKQDILNSAGETTEHLREETVIVPDPADRATIEEEHALELRTRDRERKLLKKIEQSIARIDAGDYGYCDETGEPIGVGRLLARPTATLSLEAQQRRELKQKMFGD